MSRAVWFAAGAGAGIYAMVRGRRAADALTADGLRMRWQALGVGARILRDEVAQGKVDKEAELRERLGVRADGTPQLMSGRAAADEESRMAADEEKEGTD